MKDFQKMLVVAWHVAVSSLGRRVMATAVTGALFLAGSNGSVAAAVKPESERCAILATEEVQATGLADLMTASLSAAGDIELVERGQLGSVIREQQLSACFGSTAAPQRLKLGQLLQADILVFLSMAKSGTITGSANEKQPVRSA